MAGYLTEQQLRNGSADAETLDVYVNGLARTQNVNRAGNDIGTVADIRIDVQYMAADALSRVNYRTVALMNADSANHDKIALVYGDTVESNNGTYFWNGTTREKTPLQPAAMSYIDNKLLPYRGVMPAGSLAQRHSQGVYLCAAGTTYTDVPEGWDPTQSYMFYSINWSTDTLNRYQEQTIKMFADPAVAWNRRYDNNNPAANTWQREALNTYRGVTTKTNANDITEPGSWLYTSLLTNLPIGAPSSGVIEVEQFGTYRFQHNRSLSDVNYRQSRIIRVSPVEQGGWSYSGGSYRGALSAGSVNDYLESGDYLFTTQLSGMPADGPTSGFFIVRKNGDYLTREVQTLTTPYVTWREAYRISTGIAYGWGRVGAGAGSLSGRYAFFGDSMTQGGTYVEDIQARSGITALKFGFGGCNLGKHNRTDASDPYYDKVCMYNLARYIATGDFTEAVDAAQWLYENTTSDFRATVATMAATDWSTVKVLSMFFGTNDYGAGTALGNSEDVTADGSTFYGAINYIVQTLAAAYPQLRVVFVTPPFRWRGAGVGGQVNSDVNPHGTSGLFLREYVQALLDRGEAHKLPVCDLLHKSGINALNHAHTLPDDLHPGAGAYGGQTFVNGTIYGFVNDLG